MFFLTLCRTGCEKHPRCCIESVPTRRQSHLVNVCDLLVYHHGYYSFLCCCSSCREQVFTPQPVTQVAPGGKRCRTARLPACSIEMAQTSPTSYSPPPTFFFNILGFLALDFKEKKSTKWIKKKRLKCVSISHTFISHHIGRLFFVA